MKMTLQKTKNLVHVKQHNGVSFFEKRNTIILLNMNQVFSSLQGHLHFLCIFSSLLWSNFFEDTQYKCVQIVALYCKNARTHLRYSSYRILQSCLPSPPQFPACVTSVIVTSDAAPSDAPPSQSAIFNNRLIDRLRLPTRRSRPPEC